MIIRTLAAAASAAALLSGAAAQDAGVFYLEVGLGVAVPSEDEVTFEGTDPIDGTPFGGSFDAGFETGAQFHILAGYEVTPTVAVEIESRAHAHTDEFSSDDEATSVGAWLINAVYRGSEAQSVVPYAGVGIGYANLSFSDGTSILDDGFDGAFAYQLKGGVAKPVGIHHSFALEASYLGTTTFEQETSFDTTEFQYGGFNVGVNYRYRFGAR